jgi:hypothetical protein|tara:strand:- start:209 stop:640 length:432 start_codon:yes stop_codon:yes gene_type:complete
MKKRGVESGGLVLISIITLIVALVVGLLYPRIAKVYGTGEIVLKTTAARDIALIIDEMYVYPYDINVEFDYDLSNFIVEISQNSVKIYSRSFVTLEGDEIQGNDPSSAEYSFTTTRGSDLDLVFDKPRKLHFNKVDGELSITK